MTDDLLAAAREIQQRTVALRRVLHRQPETGLTLPITRRAVLDELSDLDLEVTTSSSTSAVVATLSGGSAGPTVLLRADMDGLPLCEDTGLDFASETGETMHACGHDTHTAMLAGAARLLTARRDRIAGRVAFFFQPGEEGYFGAQLALDEGLLDFADVAGAFALHISTGAPSGTVAVRAGAQLAAGDQFRVTVRGQGGHGSMPHLAADPIPVACEIVTALQAVMTRRVSPFQPAVLTVAHISAGTTTNVIPSDAWFEGTIRTFDETVRTAVHEQVRRVAEGIAGAHGMTAEVEIRPGYPVTLNDPASADRVHRVAAGLLGADRSELMPEPVMASEDFSFILQRYPGAIAFLGGCPPDDTPETAPRNHSDLVVFDEGAMVAGVATYAGLAVDVLGSA
ncbi:MAG: M20 metallopeptidase family protein [Streptosporangiales bacterium]